MGTGSSKGTAQIVPADERLSGNHTTSKNTTSNADDTVLHIGKPSKNVESHTGSLDSLDNKPSLNNSNANNVALRTVQDGEDNVQDVDGEKNPQLEPRLISAKKHYQALKEALVGI